MIYMNTLLGRIHYCYTDYQGIHTWALMNEQDHDYTYDQQKFKWSLAHTVPHQILLSQNSSIFLRLDFSDWKPYYISPYAYSEDSQTLFLRLPGIFAAYNLRTRTLKEVCNYSFPGTNFYCCSFFPVVYNGRQEYAVVMGNITGFGGETEAVVVRLPIADTLLCQRSKAEGS